MPVKVYGQTPRPPAVKPVRARVVWSSPRRQRRIMRAYGLWARRSWAPWFTRAARKRGQL